MTLVMNSCTGACSWHATDDRYEGERLFTCAGCGSGWVASQRWTPQDADGTVSAQVQAERESHPA